MYVNFELSQQEINRESQKHQFFVGSVYRGWGSSIVVQECTVFALKYPADQKLITSQSLDDTAC